jgi:hypothetical protein
MAALGGGRSGHRVLLAAAGGRLGVWLACGQRLQRFSRTSGGLFVVAGVTLAAMPRRTKRMPPLAAGPTSILSLRNHS